jgi:hypothetical protein
MASKSIQILVNEFPAWTLRRAQAIVRNTQSSRAQARDHANEMMINAKKFVTQSR